MAVCALAARAVAWGVRVAAAVAARVRAGAARGTLVLAIGVGLADAAVDGGAEAAAMTLLLLFIALHYMWVERATAGCIAAWREVCGARSADLHPPRTGGLFAAAAGAQLLVALWAWSRGSLSATWLRMSVALAASPATASAGAITRRRAAQALTDLAAEHDIHIVRGGLGTLDRLARAQAVHGDEVGFAGGRRGGRQPVVRRVCTLREVAEGGAPMMWTSPMTSAARPAHQHYHVKGRGFNPVPTARWGGPGGCAAPVDPTRVVEIRGARGGCANPLERDVALADIAGALAMDAPPRYPLAYSAEAAAVVVTPAADEREVEEETARSAHDPATHAAFAAFVEKLGTTSHAKNLELRLETDPVQRVGACAAFWREQYRSVASPPDAAGVSSIHTLRVKATRMTVDRTAARERAFARGWLGDVLPVCGRVKLADGSLAEMTPELAASLREEAAREAAKDGRAPYTIHAFAVREVGGAAEVAVTRPAAAVAPLPPPAALRRKATAPSLSLSPSQSASPFARWERPPSAGVDDKAQLAARGVRGVAEGTRVLRPPQLPGHADDQDPDDEEDLESSERLAKLYARLSPLSKDGASRSPSQSRPHGLGGRRGSSTTQRTSPCSDGPLASTTGSSSSSSSVFTSASAATSSAASVVSTAGDDGDAEDDTVGAVGLAAPQLPAAARCPRPEDVRNRPCEDDAAAIDRSPSPRPVCPAVASLHDSFAYFSCEEGDGDDVPSTPLPPRRGYSCPALGVLATPERAELFPSCCPPRCSSTMPAPVSATIGRRAPRSSPPMDPARPYTFLGFIAVDEDVAPGAPRAAAALAAMGVNVELATAAPEAAPSAWLRYLLPQAAVATPRPYSNSGPRVHVLPTDGDAKDDEVKMAVAGGGACAADDVITAATPAAPAAVRAAADLRLPAAGLPALATALRAAREVAADADAVGGFTATVCAGVLLWAVATAWALPCVGVRAVHVVWVQVVCLGMLGVLKGGASSPTMAATRMEPAHPHARFALTLLLASTAAVAGVHLLHGGPRAASWPPTELIDTPPSPTEDVTTTIVTTAAVLAVVFRAARAHHAASAAAGLAFALRVITVLAVHACALYASFAAAALHLREVGAQEGGR